MTKSKHHSLNPHDYWQPRYWPTWLAIGSMWVLGHLPFRAQSSIASLIAAFLYRTAKKRRHIAETNIRLCFPELNGQQQDKLVKDIFFNNAMGFIETCISWFNLNRKQLRTVQVHGLEYFKQAEAKPNGILLIGGHYSMLDLAGALISAYMEQLDTVQREHNNPLLNAIQTRSREQFIAQTITRKDMRSVIRNLKEGRTVWYAPDQDYGRKNSVFAPFFGVPAASLRSTGKIAKATGATVLSISYFRDEQGHYHIYFGKPLDNFPSDDEVTDATRINQIIENEIRRYPAQYLWLHRRFKTRPDNEAPFY